MQTEHVLVGNVQEHFDRVDDILEKFLQDEKITGKNAMRFSLLCEEAVRLVKSIAKESSAVEMWIEGDARVANIFLRLQSEMDANKQAKFVSVATSGVNSAERTFFDYLRGMFIEPVAPSWSLSEYQAELRMKRERDELAQESWDDLERSLLANLASDVSVSVKGKDIFMAIRKDFTESLSTVDSRKPLCSSRQLYFTNDSDKLEVAWNAVDDCVEELELSRKDALHMKLLFEETIGMFKAMTGEFNALIWAEKYQSQCALKIVSSTKMDLDKKTELLSAATNKENAKAKGFMGKVRDVIETFGLSYDNAMKLQMEYNGDTLNYSSMGMYYDPGINADPAIMGGVMWSLGDYRDSLDQVEDKGKEVQEAWDELEKSIVANIAKDVIVGVQKNHVEMTIIMDLEEGK